MRSVIALLPTMLALAACAGSTAVPIDPDFTPARLVPAESVIAEPALAQLPKQRSGRSGAEAIAYAQKSVRVRPVSSEIEGTTWRIDEADSTKIYVIPVSPLQPTTIRLPVGEALSENGAVSGSTSDISIGQTRAGERPAITVMPKCAAPNTKRFGPEAEVFVRQCKTGVVPAQFLTNAEIYNVELQITDYTAASIVEFNHAPPPPTNVAGIMTPRPTGPITSLEIYPSGNWNPGWRPNKAWADPDKLVIEFAGTLVVLPGLYPLGGNVNYSVIETEATTYMVTSRRVTEAQLMLDDQIIQISDPEAGMLVNKNNASPRPADWRG